MKKKIAATKRTAVAKAKPDNLAMLVTEVCSLIQSARRGVASVVDTFQLMTNSEIGRRIVEHEQKGEKRAEYRTGLIKRLSQRLTAEVGRGFSEDNLSNMRKISLLWKPRVVEYPNTLCGNSATPLRRRSSGKSAPLTNSVETIRKSPFTLSWTRHQVLLSIKASAERNSSEVESTNEGWSMPEENPTIGLVRCREKNYAVVELTRPEDANIKAKEYQLYLPSKELLKTKLLEWTRAEESNA